MRLKMGLEAAFGNLVDGGLTFVPEKWIEMGRRGASGRLLDLLVAGQNPVEIRKMPSAEKLSDVVAKDSDALDTLLTDMVGDAETQFVSGDLPLVEALVPQMIAWIAHDYPGQFTFLPEDGVLIRLVVSDEQQQTAIERAGLKH